MPTYEYACSACGETHEAFQRITDEALTECPACGEHALARVIGTPLVQFKGGDWAFSGMSARPHEKMERNRGRKKTTSR